jgi:LDH2 family malate/lactate/ureidoglycolate dehydrogenase
MMSLSHNMVGMSLSNGTAMMPAWGSKEASLCNMPISIAAPAKREFPLVLDMALSVAARGHIILADKRSEKIPDGWAIDEDGVPTQDPQKALKGAVLPIGGYKGAGLAVMLEVLTAVLLGGKFSRDCGYLSPADFVLSKPLGFNNLMIAINIENFVPVVDFMERIDELVQYLKQSRKAKGVDEILMPGEKEFLISQQGEKEGISLSAPTVEELKLLAKKYYLQSPFC